MCRTECSKPSPLCSRYATQPFTMMYTSPLLQYIGEMAKDYIYAVVPLLVDAMMERDQVHRQIAIDAVAHLALGRLLYYSLQ